MPQAKERAKAGGREGEREREGKRGIRAVNCLANGAHYKPPKNVKIVEI